MTTTTVSQGLDDVNRPWPSWRYAWRMYRFRPRRQLINLAFVFVGWGYFLKAFLTNETFVSSSWQPITWPFKLSMPLAGTLLLVQGVSECLKCLHTLRTGQWPEPPAPPEVVV